MFTRLTATVIISAPDASCAFTITAGEVYLPVPTMRREENRLSAISSMVVGRTLARRLSAAADEVDDFHLIAVVDECVSERRVLEHDEVVLDRDAAGIDVQPAEQLAHRKRAGGFGDEKPVAIQCNLQTVPHFIAHLISYQLSAIGYQL